MTNYSSGHAAEQDAADFLRQKGFVVRELNWRTRLCEIDIIAEKTGVLYFVEVKARTSGRQGRGLDYVTPKKLKQMEFAAELWVQQHQWSGDYRLAAVGVDQGEFDFTEIAW